VIRALLLDLDGTLFDRDAALREFVEDQHRRLALAEEVELETYADRFVALDERGRVWKDQVYEELVAEFDLSVSAKALLADYEASFARFVVPFPGLPDALREIRETGVKLGLVSNGRTEFQWRTFRATCLESHFDAVIVSEAVGLRKPDPEIFLLALEQLGAEPDEAVFVGDDPNADIRGAHAVGMRAVWVASRYHETPAEADAVIHRMNELVGIMAKW
jgi:putative hydrolase of the HAD superfamily